MGVGQVKMLQNLAALTKFQLLFQNKHSLDCANFLLICRILENLILIIFTNVLSHCFYGDMDFQRSLLCPSEVF